jgi:hypothetical protein
MAGATLQQLRDFNENFEQLTGERERLIRELTEKFQARFDSLGDLPPAQIRAWLTHNSPDDVYQALSVATETLRSGNFTRNTPDAVLRYVTAVLKGQRAKTAAPAEG